MIILEAVGVKIEEEDNALRLLWSLSFSNFSSGYPAKESTFARIETTPKFNASFLEVALSKTRLPSF